MDEAREILVASGTALRQSDPDNLRRMQSQGEFDFQAGKNETGYAQWVVARQEALDVVAHKMNLPLGHAVEIWLRGGVRLRGRLRLLNEVLFIEESRVQSLALLVDGVSFTYSEMDSCVRID